MKLINNHKEHFYFQNIFESKPLETVSGRDDLNRELPKCYVTTFRQALGQLERVQNTRAVVDAMEDELINFPDSNVIARERVQALLQAHEEYCRAINHLHLLIGVYNCTVNNADFVEAGYKKIKSEYLKSMFAYQDKYQPALATLEMILSDFYSQDANLPYKPERVIDAIEDLYNKNAPPHL